MPISGVQGQVPEPGMYNAPLHPLPITINDRSEQYVVSGVWYLKTVIYSIIIMMDVSTLYHVNVLICYSYRVTVIFATIVHPLSYIYIYIYIYICIYIYCIYMNIYIYSYT